MKLAPSLIGGGFSLPTHNKMANLVLYTIDMKSITYIQYSPHSSSKQITLQVVRCYQAVFADSPWNEWKKCPKCKQYWGTKDSELLKSWKFRHCDGDLIDFWSQEKVISDLRHEITKKTSCWVAMDTGKVIGFCWGYPIEVSELEQKLQTSLGEQTKEKRIGYQDEVGVLAKYRNHGIAKKMVYNRLCDFIDQNLNYGIVRTRRFPEASTTFVWYKRLGYKILSEYSDGRVILGRPLTGLMELLKS